VKSRWKGEKEKENGDRWIGPFKCSLEGLGFQVLDITSELEEMPWKPSCVLWQNFFLNKKGKIWCA
jgi:hypothetical protein